MIYDVAIIGGGPAGASAAINAKLLDKNFIWLSACAISKKVKSAELVKNYLGLPAVTGAELGWTFLNHAQSMGIELYEEVVTGVYETGGKFALLAGNKDFEAKTVVLCLGVQTQKPIEGEEKFLGKGVSYCATCDGFMYRGKTIAVYSADKHFEGEIKFLCSVAKKVYVLPMYRDCEIKSENSEIILKQPVKVTGGLRAEALEFKDGKISVDGVFILRNSVAPETLVHGLKTDGGHIMVDRAMRTNIDGIFAAGDCTGRPYQYIKSAGEGNVALHSAVEYLSKKG